MKTKGTVYLLSALLLAGGCAPPVRSVVVDGSEPAEGIVYYLPQTKLTIGGKYQIWGEADKGTEVYHQAVISADPASWTIAYGATAAPGRKFAFNPRGNGPFIAYDSADGANKVTISEEGILTAINYKAQDKTLDVVKDLGTAAATVFRTATGLPLSGLLSKSNERAGKEWKLVGEVTVSMEVALSSELDRRGRTHGGGRVTIPLAELARQVRGSQAYQILSRNEIPIKSAASPVLTVSAEELLSVRQGVDVSNEELKTLGFYGVLARNVGPCKVSISESGVEQKVQRTALVEAGGFQILTLKPVRFGTATEKISFGDRGHPNSWGGGADSSAASASSALAEVLGAIQKERDSIVADRETKRQTEETARAQAETALTTAIKAERTAVTTLANAQIDLEQAEDEVKKFEANEVKAQEEVDRLRELVESAKELLQTERDKGTDANAESVTELEGSLEEAEGALDEGILELGKVKGALQNAQKALNTAQEVEANAQTDLDKAKRELDAEMR
ncbi:MAG: hypothetical protein AAGC74_13490 [Verrucomicrobiota bacterium]